MKKKLRLVKVLVQPMFVIDDGETLTEAPSIAPLAIAPEFWNDYPTTGFAEGMTKLQAQLDEHGSLDGSDA